MELKLLSLSEDDKLIRECMEQASAFYGCLGKMGVTEILCDRKKAQELGADCQITGIFTGGELTAFACAFEYTGLKRNGRKWLNPGDKEWRQIETLGTNVVVIPLLVGKEKVGRLIELLREQYRDSHLLFRISGEQSEKFQEDLAVVSEKNLKSHRYDAAGENVWLFHFAPQIRMEDTYFEEEILLILPGQEVLLEMGIEEAEVTMVKLTGYEIVRSEKGSAFFRKPGAACEGVLLQCDYEQLLRYQRFINLTNYEEHFEQTDRGKALIYSEKYQSDSSLLWNDLLREMVKTRKAEWSIVPDSYIMYPVTYKEQDRLLECACYDNQEIGNYMHYMDIRLQCETGVPFGKDGIDLMERYKNRLERIPLGRLRVRITLEMILDILDHEDQPVGCDAEAEAVLSIDRLSHIGVLTLVSLSTPFLLSHFLDNIVRNQLMVIEENGEAVNLYAYMQEKWGLNASGTPKSYEMIPKEKNCLNKKQLGAVLLSETIYEEGEDFGEFTDAEILKLTNSETGMGQYSRAFVVAHTNVLLDFEKDLRGTIQARMYNAAFTCFYVELLMFEEAALTCFNKELIDLMAEVMRIEPTEFLTRARTITNRYLNTVDFWNVSVNYPSSQKSLQMIRKSFLIDDLKEKMEYNQKQVGNIFDINREIVDRQEAKEEKERDDQSNTALTILSVLCFLSRRYRDRLKPIYLDVPVSEEVKKAQDELNEKYGFSDNRPQELIFIATRKHKKDEEHIYESWKTQFEMESSNFSSRNKYPNNCRFICSSITNAENSLYMKELTEFWVSVLTLAINRIPASSLQAYRLYKLGMQASEEELERLLNKRLNRMESVYDFVQERMKMKAELSFEEDDILVPEQKIPVHFDGSSGKELYINTSKIGLSRDCPKDELFTWIMEITEKKRQINQFLKAPRRAIDKASQHLKGRAESFFGDEYKMDQFQVEDLEAEIERLETNVLENSTSGLVDEAKFKEQIEKVDKKVKKDIVSHIRRSTAVQVGCCLLLVYLLGFVPYWISAAKLGGSQFGSAVVVALAALAVAAAGGIAALFILRYRVRMSMEEYNHVIHTMVNNVNASADEFGKYFTAVCTYMKAQSIRAGIKLKSESISSAQFILRAHKQALKSSIERDEEVAASYGIRRVAEVEKNITSFFHEEKLPKDNALYYYETDKSDVGIPLNEAGDLVRAPYKFVAKLKLEREDLYDEVKGEV